MESSPLKTFVQSEKHLEQAQQKLQEVAKDLAFMEIIGREERLELPRITPLNQPMIERALLASKTQQAEPHAISDLQRAVDYYQTLGQLNDSVAVLQDKIRSTQLTLGARIYRRSKRIFSAINKKEKDQLEPIFFPLQPDLEPKKRKTHQKRVRNEAIPIADIEGI